MKNIWEKLNLKDELEVMILNSPTSFENNIHDLQDLKVFRSLNANSNIPFILSFVTEKTEIQRIASNLLSKTVGDVIVWFSYPKGTSKKYKCDFNRDAGWEPVQEIGFRPVRQIAIDKDWTALRFRRREYVRATKKG